MTINKDISTSNRILCPPYLPTRPLKQQHRAKAIIEIDSFTGHTDYRRNQTCSLQKCQVPFSPPLWVCMHVSNIKGKHRFFGVCAVLLGGSYSRSGSRVLRPCLSHDVSCSLVLLRTARGHQRVSVMGRTEGINTVLFSRAKHHCLYMTGFFQTSRVSAHLELGMFFTLT